MSYIKFIYKSIDKNKLKLCLIQWQHSFSTTHLKSLGQTLLENEISYDFDVNIFSSKKSQYRVFNANLFLLISTEITVLKWKRFYVFTVLHYPNINRLIKKNPYYMNYEK